MSWEVWTMKSRTSFFDPAVFKKNLTRFAPAWGLYTLCLLLGLMLMAESDLEYWLPKNLGQCIQIMPFINCGYALVAAQLLFGDLFNTRMCNALHALPIRREAWFGTNVLSGLVFSLGPSLVMILIALPLTSMSSIEWAWQMPLLWLLGSNLQFLFFFAVAVLCVFCVGSRFAMALVYGIINLGAVIAYWLADTIYVPMLFGVEVQYEAFRPFFPVGAMMAQPYTVMERIYGQRGKHSYVIRTDLSLTDRWGYLWLCAGVGILLLAAALLLYRRRKLETAGDLIAVKPLEPVFLVLYSLMAAAFFHLFDTLFLGDHGYFLLAVGLAVGFFTGKMLLERRVNVFRKKNWMSFGLLTLAVGASLVLTWLDPLGIETWMPKAEKVDRVVLSLGYDYGYGNADSVVLEDPQDIEDLFFVHRAALEDRIGEDQAGVMYIEPEDTSVKAVYSPRQAITIRYELKNGTKVTRYYQILTLKKEGQLVEGWFSSLYSVTGTDDLVGKMGSGAQLLRIEGLDIPHEYLADDDYLELLKAVEKDCAEGNMAQSWNFHRDQYVYRSGDYSVSSLYLELTVDGFDTSFEVYGDSRHTLAWLKENGVLDYLWTIYYGEKYR